MVCDVGQKSQTDYTVENYSKWKELWKKYFLNALEIGQIERRDNTGEWDQIPITRQHKVNRL